MELMLSLNFKFYEVSPKEMIEIIKEKDTKKSIKGFELCFDSRKEKDREYATNLAYLCKSENFKLQFHGDSSMSIEDQKEYLKFVDNLSSIVEYPVSVVLHPITGEKIENMQQETNLYFSEVLDFIYENNLKVNVTIENLNSVTDIFRLAKEYIKPIVANNMDLGFTYDMGHETVEYGRLTNLDPVLVERISNVHIHTFSRIEDHQPIGVNSNKEWIKSIQYLKYLNYDKTVVLEYDFYTLGDDYYERMNNYIKCAEYLYDYVEG